MKGRTDLVDLAVWMGVRLDARIAMNEHTAELHPDERARENAMTRISAYRLAKMDLMSWLDENKPLAAAQVVWDLRVSRGEGHDA